MALRTKEPFSNEWFNSTEEEREADIIEQHFSLDTFPHILEFLCSFLAKKWYIDKNLKSLLINFAVATQRYLKIMKMRLDKKKSIENFVSETPQPPYVKLMANIR
ncbi:hypothetical protein NPIL_328371 [Nephila pilipes]|uniref:Uncharacterized protein n=1 Tax=Nephila pilipes TaxID=299642 RepID=A0A8X6TR33_NEPPI|nr:hypothetical protein NPIL_328371 [Nephila pilipes]